MGTVGGTETGLIPHQLVTEAWRWSCLCGPDLAQASEGSLQEGRIVRRKESLYLGCLSLGTRPCLGELSRENLMVKRQFPFS